MSRAFYNDIDPFCCAVTARHVATGELPPGEVVCRDVKELAVDDLRAYTQWHCFCGIGGMPYGLRLGGWPDAWPILTAGFPCQPTSLAGKRLAQADPRWLWPEVIRLVRGLRPPVVLLENPPGLLARGFGDILRDLAEAGYDASWRVLAAADVGAPHRRERVWVVAYPAGARRHRPTGSNQYVLRPSPVSPRFVHGGAMADSEGVGRPLRATQGPRPGGFAGCRTVADPGRPGLPESEPERQHGRPAAECGRWAPEPRLGGMPDGLSRGVDGDRWPARWGAPQNPWEPPRTVTERVPFRRQRLQALGNAVVPQVVAALVPWITAGLVALDGTGPCTRGGGTAC